MTVAVAHSGTPAGQAAVRAAVAEARLRRAPLTVLHVVAQTRHDHEPDVRQRVRTEIGELEIDYQLRLADEGRDPAGALVDLAVEVGAELLVLGSRRRSPVGKVLLGSVVQRVLLDCPLPVMVVKAPQ